MVTHCLKPKLTVQPPENSLGPLFSIYSGQSMRPTLQEGDLLETILSKSQVQPGDVILFTPPGKKDLIIHRVVRKNGETIRTRGDNCPAEDPWVLTTENIRGQVIAFWRNNQRHRVYGHFTGKWNAALSKTIQRAHTCMRPLLRILYRAVRQINFLPLCLPQKYRVRVVTSRSQHTFQKRLLFGNRVVGWYQNESHSWRIHPLYRLFVDKNTLEKIEARC